MQRVALIVALVALAAVAAVPAVAVVDHRHKNAEIRAARPDESAIDAIERPWQRRKQLYKRAAAAAIIVFVSATGVAIGTRKGRGGA